LGARGIAADGGTSEATIDGGEEGSLADRRERAYEHASARVPGALSSHERAFGMKP
jgi:hypothetical protein